MLAILSNIFIYLFIYLKTINDRWLKFSADSLQTSQRIVTKFQTNRIRDEINLEIEIKKDHA